MLLGFAIVENNQLQADQHVWSVGGPLTSPVTMDHLRLLLSRGSTQYQPALVTLDHYTRVLRMGRVELQNVGVDTAVVDGILATAERAIAAGGGARDATSMFEALKTA